MKKVIRGILGHKFIIILISVLVLIGGFISYKNIPKQEMPEIKPVFGYIHIIAPGLNSNEIQDRIAVQVGDIITNYGSVENYSATSVDNACIVVIEMDLEDASSEDTLLKIKNDVLNTDIDESITDIEFVTDIKTAHVIYAVHSKDLSEYSLKLVAGKLADKLAGVENVVKTRVDSAYSEEVVINIDNEKLNELPLTVLDVFNAVYANGVEIPMGGAELDGENSSILVNGNFVNLESIRNIAVYADDEGITRISDIATVGLYDSVGKEIYEFNGNKAAFVEMFFDDNIDFTVLGDEISDVTDKFKSNLKENVEISEMVFSPDHVQEQVDQVISNLLLCVVIVLGVIMLGLGIRNSLAIAVTIPVIAMATVGVVYILGYQLQLISIAGMIVSIGVLVDNSIVISEATQHNLDMGMKRKKACIKAVCENYIPVLTSTLTTITVFIALLFLPGIPGEVAFTLPLTILTSITLSYIVSITLTPVLASVFFKKKSGMKKTGRKVEIALTSVMKWGFKLSVIPTVVAFLLLGGLAYFIVRDTEIDILPKTEKSIVYINYEFGKINDAAGAYDFAKEIEAVVKTQKDVKNYAFSQGGDLPKFYMSLNVLNNLPNTGRFFIEYECDSKDLPEYMDNLEDDLKSLSDKGVILVNRLELSLYTAPLQVILMDDDYGRLLEKSGAVFEKVQNLDSFGYGELLVPGYKDDLDIDIDRQKASEAGLSIAEIEQQIAVAANGISERLYENEGNLLDVRVSTGIDSVKHLEELKIKNSAGIMVSLSDLADLEKVENLEYIKTYNGVPAVVMEMYDSDGYSTYELEDDIREQIEKTGNGIDAEFKGDNEMINETLSGLSVLMIIAVVIIYLIMYFQFDSLRQPLIILTTIPLSFIGSLAAILIFGEKISVTTLLGIASLVGIVVNNGILLVEYINMHRKTGHNVYESCVKAVSRRLRPILLASLTTILGVIPLALTGGDFFRPMAVTFMGGMMISALLVLIIVPGLYYVTYRRYDKNEHRP